MYFSYYEEGYGEFYFQALYYPFQVTLSQKIPEIFLMALN